VQKKIMPPKNVYASKREAHRDERSTGSRGSTTVDAESAVIAGIQSRFDAGEDDLNSFVKHLLHSIEQPGNEMNHSDVFDALECRMRTYIHSHNRYASRSNLFTVC
jgi:hypothetical protein